MMSFRWRLLVTLVALVLTPPHRRLRADTHDTAYTIGVLSGLTGLAAKWDHFQNNGIRLAQEEFLRDGIKVQLVVEDSQTSGSGAITALNKLITVDKVDAVIVSDYGFVAAPLIPIADRERKLMITTFLPQPEYCARSKGYFFSIGSKYAETKGTVADFFRSHREIKRAATFVFDDPEWGGVYERIWREVAEQQGVEVVETFRSSEPTPDFKSALAKALRKKPDLLLVAHEPVTFLRAARGLGYDGAILGANNLLELLSEKHDLHDILPDVTIVDPDISEPFRASYLGRFGEPPILEAYTGYEALQTVVKALQLDRKHPERAIQTIRYRGVAGEINFTGGTCSGNFARWRLAKLSELR